MKLPLFLALFALYAFGFPSASLGEETNQPNILVIISDDMGYADVGLHGSKIPTPNLDKLIGDGVKLDRFYVNPQCSATRMTMLTGRNSARYGVRGAIRRGTGIPDSVTTLPRILQQAGYQTWLCGKWHVGSEPDFHPQRKGFDSFYGFLGGGVEYFQPSGSRRADWQRDGKAVVEEGYSTDLLASEAIRLIEKRQAEKPFYLQLAFNAPHSTLAAPADVIETMRATVGDSQATYAAVITLMDRAIGRVLAALDTAGVGDDTLVLFFNDNGAHARRGPRVHYSSNAPLSGGKSFVAEGGIRVLAGMRWPGMLKPGTTSVQLTGGMDMLPTLCAAAGVELPPDFAPTLDGKNVWAALRSGTVVERNPMVILDDNGGIAVLMDEWKVTTNSRGSALYNVVQDPGEQKDLAIEKPKILNALLGVAAPFEPFK